MRIGGTRVGVVDDDQAPRRRQDGSVTAELTLKLETTVKPLPVDSTVLIRPRSALGLKYVEITKGTSSEGFQDGATIPLRNATPQPGRDRRGPQHVRRQDARGVAEQPDRVRRRARRPRAGPQRRDRGAQPAAASTSCRSCATCRTRARALARFFRALGRDRARSSRRSPRRRPTLFAQPRHDVHARSPTSRGPFIQDSISGGPPALDDGDQGLPAAAAVPGQRDGALPRAAPGRRARCATAAPDLADALEIGTPTLQALGRVQQAPDADLRGAASASPRTRWSPLGVQRPARAPRRSLNPTIAVPRRRSRRSATTRRCGSATSSSLLSEGDSNGTGAALHHHRHARRARTTRAARRRRPPTAASRAQDNYLHTNPYPNTARAGPAEGVRGRQRALHRRQAGRSATCPGNQGTPRPRRRSRSSDARSRRRSDDERVPRKDRTGASPFVVGVVVLVVVVHRRLLRLHQAHPVHARLPRQGRLPVGRTRSGTNSPVRIAGVNVGKVTKIERKHGTDAAVVTMEIDDKGLPIHKDADAEDPPAHLPRGQLLRRPRSPARRRRRRSTTATRSRSPRRRRRCSSTRC